MVIKWLAGGVSVVQFLRAKTYMAESGWRGERSSSTVWKRRKRLHTTLDSSMQMPLALNILRRSYGGQRTPPPACCTHAGCWCWGPGRLQVWVRHTVKPWLECVSSSWNAEALGAVDFLFPRTKSRQAAHPPPRPCSTRASTVSLGSHPGCISVYRHLAIHTPVTTLWSLFPLILH